jgi:hypothetical protein
MTKLEALKQFFTIEALAGDLEDLQTYMSNLNDSITVIIDRLEKEYSSANLETTIARLKEIEECTDNVSSMLITINESKELDAAIEIEQEKRNSRQK